MATLTISWGRAWGHVFDVGSKPSVHGSAQSSWALGCAHSVRAQVGGGACGLNLRRAWGCGRSGLEVEGGAFFSASTSCLAGLVAGGWWTLESCLCHDCRAPAGRRGRSSRSPRLGGLCGGDGAGVGGLQLRREEGCRALAGVARVSAGWPWEAGLWGGMGLQRASGRCVREIEEGASGGGESLCKAWVAGIDF